MADPREARDRGEFLRRAAAETREPDAARRLRTEGPDGDAQARRDDGMDLRDTADALAESRERLRDTGSALEERGRDLAQTRQLTEELAERAQALRADTSQTAESARAIPTPDVEARDERGDD